MSNLASIRLLRNTAVNAKDTDDSISIERIGAYIRIKYMDSFSNIIQRLYVSADDFPRYISTIGTFYLKDTDPYKAIQFNFPGFPMIMLDSTNLANKKTQDALLDAAYLTSASWFSDEDEQPSYVVY